MNDESLLEKFKCFVCDLFLGGVAAGRLSGSHSKFKHLIVKRTMRPLCRRWFWEADCGADTWSPAKVIEVSDIRAPRPPWEKQVQAVMCRGFLEWPLKATDWQNKRRIKKTEEAVRVQTAQQLHLHLTFQAFSWGTLEIKKKMIARAEKAKQHKARFKFLKKNYNGFVLLQKKKRLSHNSWLRCHRFIVFAKTNFKSQESSLKVNFLCRRKVTHERLRAKTQKQSPEQQMKAPLRPSTERWMQQQATHATWGSVSLQRAHTLLPLTRKDFKSKKRAVCVTVHDCS